MVVLVGVGEISRGHMTFRADVHEPEYVWVFEEGEYSGRWISGIFKSPESFMASYPDWKFTYHGKDEENIYYSAHKVTKIATGTRESYEGDITRYELK